MSVRRTTGVLGLEGVVAVSNRIHISDNDSLRDLAGLSTLLSAGSLGIQFNEVLADVYGLASLTASTNPSTSSTNPVLPTCSVEWLRDHVGMTNIGGEVTIFGNGDGPCSMAE